MQRIANSLFLLKTELLSVHQESICMDVFIWVKYLRPKHVLLHLIQFANRMMSLKCFDACTFRIQQCYATGQ